MAGETLDDGSDRPMAGDTSASVASTRVTASRSGDEHDLARSDASTATPRWRQRPRTPRRRRPSTACLGRRRTKRSPSAQGVGRRGSARHVGAARRGERGELLGVTSTLELPPAVVAAAAPSAAAAASAARPPRLLRSPRWSPSAAARPSPAAAPPCGAVPALSGRVVLLELRRGPPRPRRPDRRRRRHHRTAATTAPPTTTTTAAAAAASGAIQRARRRAASERRWRRRRTPRGRQRSPHLARGPSGGGCDGAAGGGRRAAPRPRHAPRDPPRRAPAHRRSARRRGRRWRGAVARRSMVEWSVMASGGGSSVRRPAASVPVPELIGELAPAAGDPRLHGADRDVEHRRRSRRSRGRRRRAAPRRPGTPRADRRARRRSPPGRRLPSTLPLGQSGRRARAVVAVVVTTCSAGRRRRRRSSSRAALVAMRYTHVENAERPSKRGRPAHDADHRLLGGVIGIAVDTGDAPAHRVDAVVVASQQWSRAARSPAWAAATRLRSSTLCSSDARRAYRPHRARLASARLPERQRGERDLADRPR